MRRAARRTGRRGRRRRRRRIMVTGAVLVTAGAAAVKLTQKDTEKIEEHTGQSVEDLSDEELQSAMDDMNIQSQELTDEDRAAIEAAGE